MSRRGFALLAVLWALTALSVLGGVALVVARTGSQTTRNRVLLARAAWAREACVEILLARYGQNPAVQQGLDRLTLTASSLRAPLAFLTPVQSSCNYVTLFLRNIASVLSEDTSSGTSLRFSLVAIDDVLGGEAVPSSHQYTTPATEATAEHGPVQVNPYPNTDSPGQTAECEAGNETYSGAAADIGNVPGNQGLRTETTGSKAK